MSGPQQNNMEEILSSIRTTLEDEAAKVGSGVVPEDAAADILDLSSADMLEPGKPGEELFDINAFAMSGQQRIVAPDQVASGGDPFGEGEEPVVEVVSAEPRPLSEMAKDSAEDDFDRLLAELGDAPVSEDAPAVAEKVEASAVAQEEVAMEAMSVSTDLIAEEEQASAMVSDAAPAMLEAPAADPVQQPEPTVPPASNIPPAPVSGAYQLSAVPMAAGLQVAFPVEVLAEVLRPLVKGWLEANLAGVVEKLVADEISKLTGKQG